MDWQAEWIWAKSHSRTSNFYMYARKEFSVESVTSASIHVTCSSEYKLYVNGRYVGRGPGPCHPALQYYDSYDLKRYIRRGGNVIGVLCYNHGVAPGGLFVQVEMTNRSGEQHTVVTDETWKVTPASDWDFDSVRMSPMAGFQEVYDSRRKPVGWNVVGFDDTNWDEPEVLGKVGIEPWPELVPRQIPHLREWEVFAEVSRRPEKRVVIDFGRDVVGFLTIRISDGGCGVIDIGYCESLDGPHDISQTDRLILHGGRQEWQTFGRRTFRYVQLSFVELEQPVLLESVSVQCIGYPVEQVSSFECSDELLNDIWRTGVYKLSVSMQDDYEDCPLTAHPQNMCDLRIAALMNYYCFDDRALVAKALSEHVWCRREDSPPDFNLAWVVILHDYYLYTGDSDLVKRLYSNVRLFIDQDSVNKLDEVASHNAYYYQALRDASKLAASLGENDDALRWHARAGEVFRAFNARFWRDDIGLYADRNLDGKPSDTMSVHTNALAIAFGLIHAEPCSRIAQLLNPDSVTSVFRDFSPETQASESPYQDFYVLQALAKLNMTDEALRLVRSNWSEMMKTGASTYFLPAEILGVKPSMPESDVVVIQPRVGDLRWAKGGIAMGAQLVEVEWHAERSHFRIEINAPGGFIVALPIGLFDAPVIEEIDLSPETPERRARKTYGWGNVIWRSGKERDPYLDWLKTQEVEPPEHYKAKNRCSAEDDYLWVREGSYVHVRYDIREA
ncbi:MAG: family 78 glycoside hydrolase catalytic domain [Armatimonadota bacterium]